jgi:hypothetical protein
VIAHGLREGDPVNTMDRAGAVPARDPCVSIPYDGDRRNFCVGYRATNQHTAAFLEHSACLVVTVSGVAPLGFVFRLVAVTAGVGCELTDVK